MKKITMIRIGKLLFKYGGAAGSGILEELEKDFTEGEEISAEDKARQLAQGVAQKQIPPAAGDIL